MLTKDLYRTREFFADRYLAAVEDGAAEVTSEAAVLRFDLASKKLATLKKQQRSKRVAERSHPDEQQR